MMTVNEVYGNAGDRKRDMRTSVIRLVGDSPLILHSFFCENENGGILHDTLSEMELTEQMAKDAKFVIPAESIKTVVINTSKRLGKSSTGVAVRRMFYIKENKELDGFLEVSGASPILRRVYLVTSGCSRREGYLIQFNKWSCEVGILYDADAGVSLEDIIQMISFSGYLSGIGKTNIGGKGTYGNFHVER